MSRGCGRLNGFRRRCGRRRLMRLTFIQNKYTVQHYIDLRGVIFAVVCRRVCIIFLHYTYYVALVHNINGLTETCSRTPRRAPPDALRREGKKYYQFASKISFRKSTSRVIIAWNCRCSLWPHVNDIVFRWFVCITQIGEHVRINTIQCGRHSIQCRQCVSISTWI